MTADLPAGRHSPGAPRAFDLLETLRWTPDEGFFLLERHLRRLERSARRFGYRCPLDRIRAALEDAVDGTRSLRVRLLVGPDGRPRIETAPLDPPPPLVRVALAARPIDPANPLLFHKTTSRGHLEQARVPGVDDTILWNPRGEATESLIANLVLVRGGTRVTPPASCGLLPGTFREELLASGAIVEQPISLAQLEQARRFWLINSVRGWYEAELIPRPADRADSRGEASRQETGP